MRVWAVCVGRLSIATGAGIGAGGGGRRVKLTVAYVDKDE